MASTLVDRVKLTTATLGTGPLTLAAAVQGFRDATALLDQNTYSYAIDQPTGEYEVGRGVYTQATGQLTRIVLFSSNSNSPITLTGLAVVSIVILSSDLTGFTEYLPQPQPATPASGFSAIYCDEVDGDLKVVAASGKVTTLAQQ